MQSTSIAEPNSTAAITQLAERARRGCTQSFDQLVHHFEQRLLCFVQKRCLGNRQDAEDIVQETFTRAWKNRVSFDSSFRYSAWLYQIAINITRDYLRRGSTRVPTISIHEDVSGPQVSDPLERAELCETIWDTARRTLTADQFSALWLKYAEDLTVSEIAKTLCKTHVGVRVLLFRARNHLSGLLLTKEEVQGGLNEPGRILE